MKARMYVLVGAAALGIYACSGGDNVNVDGGGTDATPAADGGGKDGTATDGATNDGAVSDGALTDGAGTDGSTTDGGSFACGTKTCNSATQYCDITKAGPDGGSKLDSGLLDGGAEIDTCLAYPASCTADGGTPSCSCISTTCTCVQSGSDITVTCP